MFLVLTVEETCLFLLVLSRFYCLFDKVRALLRLAKQELGEVLSAFEVLDRQVVDVCEKHCVGVKNPLEAKHNFYVRKLFWHFCFDTGRKVLVEAAGSNAGHDSEKMSVFTEKALESGIVADGTIAQDISQMKSFWRVREAAPEGKNEKQVFFFFFFAFWLKNAGVLHAGGKPFKLRSFSCLFIFSLCF